MKQEITKNISTENGTNEFQIRLLKNNGVGLLTTENEENYLILDSIDYWYDLIQNEYPKKKRCSCKNEWFYVGFNYIPRHEADDIKEIKIITTCTVCNKVSTPISIDIDYSPTEELIANPITFCEKPNIKYKFTELTSFWTKNNLDSFLHFTINELQLYAYFWYFKMPEKIRVFELLTIDKALKKNGNFLNLFLTKKKLEISEIIKGENEDGLLVESDIWRKEEIIKLSSVNMYEIGPLYYINFCNQYIDKGNVLDKSEEFETITKLLKNWLKENFITNRGTKCFDGQELYEKFISKRNAER